ncbi:MAG TPA: 30S ribosomal protein S6 [Myxococcales bacterium]|nr:30S ribosomal protein S6 [Myxococcales bacterium]
MQQAETQTGGGPAQQAPGTKLREYETIFLLRPDLAEDLVDKIVERLRGIVQRDAGKVIKVENWGKKKVAYEVKKHLRAVYVRFVYLGNTHMVAEFERNLRMTDDVLKYQSVKLADEVDPAKRQVEPDVKLPGDPEVPERAPREPEGFGEERGFGRERAEAEGEMGAEAEPE